jgi:deoxyadenosine/deoxycytidine kinase
MHKPFIVVAGNIGVGKSTVTLQVSEELGLTPYFENYKDNPYLANFYQDMPRWSFHSQLFFLKEGLRDHRHIVRAGGGVIQDRSIYEHFMVFAQDLAAQNFINEMDFELLSDLYYSVQDLLDPPHLLVYLKAPTSILLARIKKRARIAEQVITQEYLQRLENQYYHFLDSWTHSPILRIDMKQYDVNKTSDLEEISSKIQQHLNIS